MSSEETAGGALGRIAGKAKEVAGKVTGRDDLHREGQAQQDKADAQRDAAKKEAEAAAAPAEEAPAELVRELSSFLA